VKQTEGDGGTRERLQTSDELSAALQRALQAVTAGQTFLVDAIINP
jgi:acetolactate synthase-1/2/3 large subunit